jgi:hypothetical protein
MARMLPIVMSLIVAGSLLQWAYRGGVTKLALVAFVLFVFFVALLSRLASGGEPYHATLWFAIVVVGVTIGGMAFCLWLAHLRGLAGASQLVGTVLVGFVLYSATVYLGLLLFPSLLAV